MNKKYFSIVVLSIMLSTAIFSQTNTNKAIKGKWAKKSGFTEFFLEISDYEIKYIEKSSDKFIRYPYKLDAGQYGTSYEFNILEPYKDHTLDLDKLNKDFTRTLTTTNNIIPIKLENDELTLFFLNKKNKWEAYEMIPFEKKEEIVNNRWSTFDKVLGYAEKGAEIAVTVDAVDDTYDNAQMQSIANKCLKASRKASNY